MTAEHFQLKEPGQRHSFHTGRGRAYNGFSLLQ